MSEGAPPDQTPPAASASNSNADSTARGESALTTGSIRRPTRFNNRFSNVTGNTPRDFEGDTPKLGGVLA